MISGLMQTHPGMQAEALSADHARVLLAGGGQLVDIRPPADFGRESLPGAVNLPVGALAYEFTRLNKRSPVILHCKGGALSCRAAGLLAGQGFSRIYRLQS